MGPTPVPGASDRSPSGGEGTEGFAALLAGVMVSPPPPPVAQGAVSRSGTASLSAGEAIDGEAPGTREGAQGPGPSRAGEASDEGAPVDPRALLLRAGIRTGEPPRAPRGAAFGSSLAAANAGPASPAPTPAPHPATPGSAGASPDASGAGPARTPDVVAATTGRSPEPVKAPAALRGPSAPDASGPAVVDTARGPDRTDAPIRGHDAPTAPAAPASAAAHRPLVPQAAAALPALDVPLVELAGIDLSGTGSGGPRSSSPDVELPMDATVARALAAAGLDPADFPALQGSALAALTEAGAPSPALPVTAADRSMTRLDPEFRGRLERVVERLQTEHGIEARFLEGFRPQLRQEHLYAQGRTAPGPVVTWTRNSMHTEGRAADLKLDGGAESYRILHQVAAEEGLRTLGMKDPGHLELPRADGAAGRSAAGASSSPSGATPGSMAAAATAGPQGVARVARVAQVAAPARPGVSRAPAAPVGAASEGVGSISKPADKSEGTVEVATAHGGEAAEMRSDLRTPVPLPEVGLAPMRGPLAPGAGMAAMDRVAELEELRDAAPLGPMRRIDLRDADGQGTRVRIEMKGDVVQTEIRTPDGELARRLEPASRELEGALERHGLELGRLKVGRSADVVAPREFITPTVAEPGRGQSGGEESSRQGQQRTPRDGNSAHEQPRHRPRPDHPDREYQP